MPTDWPLPPIPGGWCRRRIRCGQRTYSLTLPRCPDAFLDAPEVLRRHERTGYMPYWAYLWPAAETMARCVAEDRLPLRSPVVELGCGTGLVGLAAAARGHRVTFSDHDPLAVGTALHNARRNGVTDVRGAVFDWKEPPAMRFQTVLGCEITYEVPVHAAVAGAIRRLLAPGGTCWLGDAGRHCAEHFLATAARADLTVAVFDEFLRPLNAPRSGRFQLFRLTHR
ncbi:MAG: methyltransferase domain-containing protein [Planctomycetota bacterium]|nr:MAG: methyltransferase domain-containing protein [Planctomycetota bacterium]